MIPRLSTCLAALALAVVLSGCTSTPPEPDRMDLTPASFDALPGWHNDDASGALQAFRRSCAAMAWDRIPESVMIGSEPVARSDWKHVCERAAAVSSTAIDARRFFRHHFRPLWVSNGGEQDGLFTGYYVIGLEAARRPYGRFRTPIYGMPSDLAPGTPYLDRDAIETQGLQGRAPVIAWAADPVAVFFLHVQGSGILQMTDGSVVRVGYAGNNGHAYRSIGKILLERGVFRPGEITAQVLKAWLREHPLEGVALMRENPRFIFFRELEDGAIRGAQGVELTPERSLAVDPAFLPYGLPLWLDTELPPTATSPAWPYRRLMVAQDTGSAITGPVRGDIFFGAGERAERLAGHMQQTGRYAVLLPLPR